MTTTGGRSSSRSVRGADAGPAETRVPRAGSRSFELILEANNAEDLKVLLQGLRAGMPAEAFEASLADLEHTLPAPAYQRLSGLAAEPVHWTEGSPLGKPLSSP